jgi:hypothetical protein
VLELPTGPPHRFHRRALVTLATLAISIAMLFVAAPEDASAQEGWYWDEFCRNVWLSPLNKAGDHCYMPTSQAAHQVQVRLDTYERAGCIALTGYYGEQVSQWYCTSKESQKVIWVPANPGLYRAIIRNNNLSYGGHFAGVRLCCQ